MSDPAVGPCKAASAAYQHGEYATALRAIRPLAERGGANATFVLGTMYEEGAGVSQEYAAARKSYELAADRGNVEAQNALAELYQTGNGMPLDYALAYMWLDIAAATGDVARASASRLGRDNVAAKMTRDQIADVQSGAEHWTPARTPTPTPSL